MSPRGLSVWALLVVSSACGGRSSLGLGAAGDDGAGGGAAGGTAAAGAGAAGGTGGGASGAAGGAGPCVPGTEVCNGIDDDCDGAIDEDDPLLGEPCSTGGLGVCAEGVYVCSLGGLACEALAQPSPEVCNGLDDDCDGAVDQGVDCTKRVFVTSALYTGDLGGLAGADAKCQAHADAVGLGGTYKAWLSASTETAGERMSKAGKPYVLVDGTLVASDWLHVISTLTTPFFHAIDLTETFGPPPIGNWQVGPRIWTATRWDGTLEEIGCRPSGWCNTCNDWTNPLGGGSQGSALHADNGWTGAASAGLGNCKNPAAIYCFEQ